MAEDSKWASYVRAHRLAQNLNQSEFAKVMNVSQQTVSRWESGSQIPEHDMQTKLRTQLRATALNSITYWRRRVENAASFDVLVGSDLTVLAASTRASNLFRPGGGGIAGEKFYDVVPHHEVNSDEAVKVQTLQHFREIGFFDGLVRSMRLDMEWHLPSGSCACKTDVWPVMTSDQVIVGHFCGAPAPIPADPTGFQGIRVQHVIVRLNKDAEE